MSLADNLKVLLQKKNSNLHSNKQKSASEVDAPIRSQVSVNKPQKKSAGRGR